MTYQLFIDSTTPPPSSNWVVAKSSMEAIAIIESNGMPTYLSIGYRLSPTDTVIPVITWLIDQLIMGDMELPESFDYFVHTDDKLGISMIDKSWGSFFRFITGKI